MIRIEDDQGVTTRNMAKVKREDLFGRIYQLLKVFNPRNKTIPSKE